MNLYIKFIFKRFFIKKSNIIFFLISLVLLMSYLFLNISQKNTLKDTFESQIKSNEESIEKYEKELLNSDEESKKMINNEIKFLNNYSNEYKKMIVLFENKDWNNLYDIYLKILKERSSVVKNTENLGVDKLESILDFNEKKIEYISYLNENNLSYENIDRHIYGVSFINELLNQVFPILITVVVLYFLVQIFTMDIHDSVNFAKILPITKNQYILSKLISGVIISFACFLFFIVAMFLISFIFTFEIGINHPVIYKNLNGSWNNMPNIIFTLKAFAINMLYLINLTIFTFILSMYIKIDRFLLIISMISILVMKFIPILFKMIKGYVHLLFTTYSNSYQIINLKLMIDYQNINLSFIRGIISLFLIALIQLSIVFLNKRKI